MAGEEVTALEEDHGASARLEEAALAGRQERGLWIHFGACGGVLTHLQGIPHPVCTKCGKEVF